jgi:hypothetical protein
MNTNKSTSRGQGRLREERSEGSPMAKVRADGQKPHRRLSPWASWHNTTKPEGSWGRANAAVAHGKLMFLSGEIRTSCDRSVMRNIRNGFNRLTKYPAYPFAVNGYESLLRETQNRQHLMTDPVALRMATCEVNVQKSAEGIVVMIDEGPNAEMSEAIL